MCGIAGFLDFHARLDARAQQQDVRRMTAPLTHRGPDGEGFWTCPAAGVAFGHRRLAILDLSEHGHEPMISRCGRYVLIFNGEVYNHLALREQLPGCGHQFAGHCDAETLLAAVAQWGVREAVERSIGMFAFAVWDRRERKLTLARDRLGQKPLFYGWHKDVFLFGSELKALRAHPAFESRIDRAALALFLRHSYVPAPFSIYKGVWKLPPGSLLEVSGEMAARPSPIYYWDARSMAEDGTARQSPMSEQEALDELNQRLEEAVSARLIADVPLGAFLSGGIDSSLIVALMQQRGSGPVKTFTIGFDQEQYNEAPFAKEVARHLGTDHVEHYVASPEAQDVIARLPQLYDEPFADSSQIPTFLVSELARRHVTVVLSGDGGDELFGGYDRYFHLQNIWRRLQRVPGRRLAAGALIAASRIAGQRLSERLRRRGSQLRIASALDLYRQLNRHWTFQDDLVLGVEGALPELPCSRPLARLPGEIEQWMWLDAVTYLPDDILVKVDRASMGVSLEARSPLLDHRVVELAWRLPMSLKIRHGTGKWILRELLKRRVPPSLFERPKRGFGVPIDVWLRSSLRDWAESLLDERRLKDEGFLQPAPIRRRWQAHLTQEGDWQYDLWPVLMFQAWLEGASRPAISQA